MSIIKQLDELLQTMRMIDLSHVLEDNMPVYPAHSRYYHTLWDSFDTGSVSLAYQLIINEHCGTHMDATAHFIREGHPQHRYMAETATKQFFGKMLTFDVGPCTDSYLVSEADIRNFEKRIRPIEKGDIIVFRFGWDRYWAPRSVDRTYTNSWPGISGEAANYLVAKNVKVVGCDTLAIDSSRSTDTPAHYALLGNGINIIENLTRLEEVVGESYLFAMPLKIKEGSGSPIRALAFK